MNRLLKWPLWLAVFLFLVAADQQCLTPDQEREVVKLKYPFDEFVKCETDQVRCRDGSWKTKKCSGGKSEIRKIDVDDTHPRVEVEAVESDVKRYGIPEKYCVR